MSEVIKSNAEAVLKRLYSRTPEVVETARRQSERLPAEEFLRLIHAFESEASRARTGRGTRIFGASFSLILSVAGAWAIWMDHRHFVIGFVGMVFWLVMGVGCFFYRSPYSNEDSERVESSLRGVLKTTQSPALVEASASLLYKRQQQEIANTTYYGNTAIDHAAHETLLRVLPMLETSEGWKPKGREALFALLQDDTYEHKLASSILDTAMRWRDVDALPQVSALAKREDRPLPLRRHANEAMTLLLAERQKRQLGAGLLRASQPPSQTSGRELLRPASGHAETPPEQLLRPS